MYIYIHIYIYICIHIDHIDIHTYRFIYYCTYIFVVGGVYKPALFSGGQQLLDSLDPAPVLGVVGGFLMGVPPVIHGFFGIFP